MRIPPLRVYLDTSVLGGYYDAEFEDDSKALWRHFADGQLVPILGEQTLAELVGAPDAVRQLLNAFEEPPEVLPETPEASDLAQAYLDEAVLPVACRGDAVHVAIASVHGINVLLSWNFKHMANVQRNRGFNAVNLKLGYSPVEIRSPKEVIHDRDPD